MTSYLSPACHEGRCRFCWDQPKLCPEPVAVPTERPDPYGVASCPTPPSTPREFCLVVERVAKHADNTLFRQWITDYRRSRVTDTETFHLPTPRNILQMSRKELAKAQDNLARGKYDKETDD